MIPARQSTALELAVGPVLDADGVAVTDCVVGDFKIKKTTGNFAALNGSATLTHVSAGVYDLVLTTSDTDTVGMLTIAIDDTVNACSLVRLQVIEEAIYDALYAASANAYAGSAGSTTLGAGAITATVIATGAIDADAIADNAIDAGALAADCITNAKIADNAIAVENIADNAITAAKIADGAIDEAAFATTAGSFAPLGIVDQGTAQSATATTVVLRSAAAFADDTLIGCTIAVLGSTQGYWQERVITDNTLSDDTVTVDTWTVTPSGTITYKIFMTPTAPASASSTIAAAVWDLATSGHTNSGTFGEAAVAAGGAGDPWTTTLPGSYTGSQAGKMLSDILTDTNELQTDWTNGGRLDLIIDATLADTNELQTDWVNGGRLDLIIDATLADTNELQTDWANGGRLDLLVDSIINNQVAASGTVNDVSATTTAFNTNLSAANNAYNDMLLKWKTGANAGLAPIPVLTYANTNGRITLTEALTAAPSNGDTFDLMVSHIHPVTQIATAVWTDTTSSDFTTAGSIGKSLFTSGVVPGASGGLFIAGSNAATTVNITGNITGNLSGSVGSVTGLTASDIAAIKAKTDSMGFTVSGMINCNVRYVNSVQIDGAGTTLDPWGPQ